MFRKLEESESDWVRIFDNLADEIHQLKKQAESDAALIASLNRYIETLEGRDKERASQIAELKNQCRELRKHLSGILPPQ